MRSVLDPSHFVARPEMLHVDESTPYHAAQRLAADNRKGGFVVTRDGEPWLFVKAASLAQAILSEADEETTRLRGLSTTPIGDLLHHSSLMDAGAIHIGRSVEARTNASSLQDQADAVFLVYDQDQHVGFFLNHERVGETLTQRLWFVCQNNHRNPDPDRGTCYQCPFPIIRTEVGRW